MTIEHIDVALSPNAAAPHRAHPDDAGADLTITAMTVVHPGHHVTVGTGVHANIPAGHVGLVVPRSSIGIRRHIRLSNSVGIIDAGYTGEIMLSLHNAGRVSQRLEAGDRVAQLLIVPIVAPQFRVVDSLTDTERGGQGVGSTGE